MRKELGLNLPRSKYFTENKTLLQKTVTKIIEKDDILQKSGGLKKVILRSYENIPARFCMLTLITLYQNSCVESSLSCWFSTLTIIVPQKIKEQVL